MEDLRAGILERLKHSLQLLASPHEVQFRLLPPFVCRGDELALDFDHWRDVALAKYGYQFSREQQSSLRVLDEKLQWLTAQGSEYWSDKAVRIFPEWRDIRFLAIHALEIFGWPLEEPPKLCA